MISTLFTKKSMYEWLPVTAGLLTTLASAFLFFMFSDGSNNSAKGFGGFIFLISLAGAAVYQGTVEYLKQAVEKENLDIAAKHLEDKKASDDAFRDLCASRGWVFIPRLRGIIHLGDSYSKVRMACTKSLKEQIGNKFNKSQMISELDQYWELLEDQANLSAK